MLVEMMKYLASLNKPAAIDPADPSVLMVPESVDAVSLERFSPHRFRERYTMVTPSMFAFIHYVNKRCDDKGLPLLCSVDPEALEAYAIFNATNVDGSPGQCDDTATCNLVPAPVWHFVDGIGGEGARLYSQRSLLNLIQDWHDYIVNPGELMSAFTTITVDKISKATSTDQDFSRERSAMEKIDMATESAEIPRVIRMQFAPFQGFGERTVELAVAPTLEDASDMRFRLRVVGYAELRYLLAKEFADTLEVELPEQPIIGRINRA